MDYFSLKKKAIMGSMQSGKVTEAEGYPLKLENAIKGNMKDYKIWGNKKGKNLLKATDFYSVCGGSYSKLTEDGRNCVRFTDNISRKYEGLTFKENTQYTVSFDCKTTIKSTANNDGGHAFKFYYTDGTSSNIFVNREMPWTHKTLTSTAGKTVAYIGLTSYTWVNWVYVDIDTFQLEEGTEATEYEPYQENDGLGAFGNVDVVTSGKNLFNYADYTTLTKYNGDDISDNWLTIDGDLFYIKYDYYNGGCWLTPTKQWELSSGTYTLSGKCKDNTIEGNLNICFCGVRWSDDTRNAGWGRSNSNDGEWYNFSYTFTIKEDKIVKGIYLQDNGRTAKSSICFTAIQLEEGTEPTEYEPYREPTTTTIDLTGHNSIMPNEYIDFKNQAIVRSDGTEEDIILPKIPLHKGYNILTASDAELEATNMYGKYLKKG